MPFAFTVSSHSAQYAHIRPPRPPPTTTSGEWSSGIVCPQSEQQSMWSG
jgi:hypothetical protein